MYGKPQDQHYGGKQGFQDSRSGKTLNRLCASHAAKRNNGATYCDVKEQRPGRKRLWIRDFRILSSNSYQEDRRMQE
jgi:hypothetical protein